MKTVLRFLCSLVALVVLVPAHAQQWDQWRGPNRDGVGDASTLPAEFSTELTEVWSLTVGEGYSGPLVIGDTIYMFSRENGEEILRALSLADGSEIWRDSYAVAFDVESAAHDHGPGPKSTPVFADGRIFTFGIAGVLSAVNAADGSVIWRHDFVGEFPKPFPIWGASMSPIVVGDRVVAHVGGDEGGAMRAFDVATGDTVWSNDEFTPGYASPIHMRTADTDVLVTQSNLHIIALDLADGATLWSMPYATSAWQNAVTPLAVGEQIVLSGLDMDIFSLRLSPGAAGWEAAEDWRSDRVPLYMSSPVAIGNRVFGMSHKRRGQYICLDVATGEQIWATRGREGENAIFTVLGDHVVLLTEEAKMVILDGTADDYTPIAEYEVAQSATWTPPAFTAEGFLIKDFETLKLLRFE